MMLQVVFVGSFRVRWCFSRFGLLSCLVHAAVPLLLASICALWLAVLIASGRGAVGMQSRRQLCAAFREEGSGKVWGLPAALCSFRETKAHLACCLAFKQKNVCCRWRRFSPHDAAGND